MDDHRNRAPGVKGKAVGQTFRLGRISGISIEVSWTVVFILWLLTWSLASYILPEAAPGHSAGTYWGVGLLAALGLLASILAHELCHAIVAGRRGVPVESITLWLLGGVARLSKQARDATTELHIALAGPATSLAIGLASLVVAMASAALSGPDMLTAAFGWLGLINIVLAVFNLLPGAPLDGGRVLAALLWRRTGDERLARKQAARAGQLVGQVLIGLGIIEFVLGAGFGGLWLALIGWFLTSAARAEEAQGEMTAAFEGVRVTQVMTRNVRTVQSDRLVADFVTGEAMTAHVSSFPVVDRDGRLQGLVTLRRLRQLPTADWSTTTLGQVAVPADQLAVAAPDELLLDVLRRGGTGDGRVIVIDNGRLAGIVTPTDVTAALERLSLARGFDR
jgi:Zn-dependent protease/predicted transcriptional regulator